LLLVDYNNFKGRNVQTKTVDNKQITLPIQVHEVRKGMVRLLCSMGYRGSEIAIIMRMDKGVVSRILKNKKQKL